MRISKDLKKWGGMLLGLAMLPVGAYSQHRIEGRVNDIEQKALPYASVRLLRTDSTFVSGTVTDSLGCYHLNQVSSNDYLLAFRNYSYNRKKRRCDGSYGYVGK